MRIKRRGLGGFVRFCCLTIIILYLIAFILEIHTPFFVYKIRNVFIEISQQIWDVMGIQTSIK
jgi:hypothetical protein